MSSSDKSIEYWDAYNKNGTLADAVLIRGEKIPECYRHAVAEIIVIHEDGDVLLMKRDYRKPNSPGLYEGSAGGSVLKGETFLQGAIRELREETGIKCDNLKKIYRCVGIETIYEGFLCITDVSKDSIVLQENETVEYRWVTKEEFKTIYMTDEFMHKSRYRLKEFVENNFKVISDCCFESESNYFRYRAAAIIIENGCLLLATNDDTDYYYSVGGGVHMGETAEEAVVREVYEETGVRYEIDHFACVHENFYDGDGLTEGKECHEIAMYFTMKSRGTKELHSDSYCPMGKEYLKWIPFNELKNITVYPAFFADRIEEAIKGLGHFVTDERS